MGAMQCGHASADSVHVRILAGARGTALPGFQKWYPDEREQGPVLAVDVCDEIRVCACANSMQVRMLPGARGYLLVDTNLVKSESHSVYTGDMRDDEIRTWRHGFR